MRIAHGGARLENKIMKFRLAVSYHASSSAIGTGQIRASVYLVADRCQSRS